MNPASILAKEVLFLYQCNIFLFRILDMNPAPISGSIIFIACISKHYGFASDVDGFCIKLYYFNKS